MKFDFDRVIDRHNTDSFKWDMNMEYFGRLDVLPMWVADMDLPCAPAVVKAIKDRADHPIYGYTVRKQDYYDAVMGWIRKRYGYDCKQQWLAFAPPGVVYAIGVMIDLITEKGDEILIPMPNYDPLFEVILKSGRTMIETPLLLENGRYTFDFEDIRKKAATGTIKALLLSSPHNPTGRVWTREELATLSAICLEHNIFMLFDEIHADFVDKNRFVSLGTLGEATLDKSMLCYSPNKGFNLGGLQMATVVLKDDDLRQRFNDYMLLMQTRLDTCFGAVAMIAAYNEGEEWLDSAIAYVEKNKAFVQAYVAENLPSMAVIPSEGTFLLWLDCTGIGLCGKALEDFMIQKAGVAFCAGYEFGKEGEAFVRMNVACPRKIVEEALLRIKNALT